MLKPPVRSAKIPTDCSVIEMIESSKQPRKTSMENQGIDGRNVGTVKFSLIGRQTSHFRNGLWCLEGGHDLPTVIRS